MPANHTASLIEPLPPPGRADPVVPARRSHNDGASSDLERCAAGRTQSNALRELVSPVPDGCRGDRESRLLPLREPVLQSSGAESLAAELPDGVIGVDAVRATAVGDDLDVVGQAVQPPRAPSSRGGSGEPAASRRRVGRRGRLFLSTPDTADLPPRRLQHRVHVYEWSHEEVFDTLLGAGLAVDEVVGLLPPPDPAATHAAVAERYGSGGLEFYRELERHAPAALLGPVVATALDDAASEGLSGPALLLQRHLVAAAGHRPHVGQRVPGDLRHLGQRATGPVRGGPTGTSPRSST